MESNAGKEINGTGEEQPALYVKRVTMQAEKYKRRREMRKEKRVTKKNKEWAKEDVFADSDQEDKAEAEAAPAAKTKAELAAGEKRKAEEAAPEEQQPPSKKKKKKKRQAEGAESKADETTKNKEASPEAAKAAFTDEKAAKDEAPEVSVKQAQEGIRPAGFFSEMTFEGLAICDNLKRALKEQKFERCTEIQAKSIPHLMNGKDVLAAAKTGSGKTLAFLVPALDLLYNVKMLPRNGAGCIVISPTRELAMQIYDVLRNISTYMSQTHGMCVGGMNRRNEADKLGKGVNTLVGTPGRLLDHMQNTKGFVYHNLVNLTIDEADRILEVGFEDEMNCIIKLLPKKRQTALFSATQTRKVADLARLSLSKPVFVEVKTVDNVATVGGLTQGYVVCPAQSRFLLLFTFLKRNRDKKVMVFMSSCNAVKFYDELLNYIDLPVTCIHGHKKQAARSTTYYNFCAAEKGTMVCTDVAARGLDIPNVDWIVQFDPPDEPKEYIHRVGRTARGAKGVGKALLFLMPEELGFLHYLRRAGIPVAEYTFPPSKIANIQNQLERVLEKNYHLHRSSRDAYRSYIHAYAAHSVKDCFDVYKLDLAQVAKAFGFSHPPKVELNLKHIASRKKQGPKGKIAQQTSSGHTFSAANPYGKREASDKRQFAR